MLQGLSIFVTKKMDDKRKIRDKNWNLFIRMKKK
jgi:hypothetical protein